MGVEPDTCPAGGDHLEHVYPLEMFRHWPDAECPCDPDFLCDENGFFWLHYGFGPDAPPDSRRTEDR